MAADNEGAAPNKKTGADTGSLASAPLGDVDTTDKEGVALKENLLADVAAPKEAITAGVVDDDIPKVKSAAVADETSSFFFSTPLYP